MTMNRIDRLIDMYKMEYKHNYLTDARVYFTIFVMFGVSFLVSLMISLTSNVWWATHLFFITAIGSIVSVALFVLLLIWDVIE